MGPNSMRENQKVETLLRGHLALIRGLLQTVNIQFKQRRSRSRRRIWSHSLRQISFWSRTTQRWCRF